MPVGKSLQNPTSSDHVDRVERLTPFLYIRWTSGPDYEVAFLCIEDGEPDMRDFAAVSFGQAEMFKVGVLASIRSIEAA